MADFIGSQIVANDRALYGPNTIGRNSRSLKGRARA